MTDGFDTLNGRDVNAMATYALAKALAESARPVEVLYTGAANAHFETLAARYAREGIRVTAYVWFDVAFIQKWVGARAVVPECRLMHQGLWPTWARALRSQPSAGERGCWRL